MSIFKKKYDLTKDFLRKEFDSSTKQYILYYGQTPINYTYLNNKTQKYLDNENQKLKTNKDLLDKEIYNDKIRIRKRQLNNLGYSDNCFEYLGTPSGTISINLQSKLHNLVTENHVLLGIYRLSNRINNEQIIDILTNGLIITGHLERTTNCSKPLGQNVSYYPDNKTIIKELMYADQYKNSIGSILIRIPDKDLTSNIYITDNEGLTRLNPKYIVGYVPLFPNHHLESIITLNDYINQYQSKQK